MAAASVLVYVSEDAQIGDPPVRSMSGADERPRREES